MTVVVVGGGLRGACGFGFGAGGGVGSGSTGAAAGGGGGAGAVAAATGTGTGVSGGETLTTGVTSTGCGAGSVCLGRCWTRTLTTGRARSRWPAGLGAGACGRLTAVRTAAGFAGLGAWCASAPLAVAVATTLSVPANVPTAGVSGIRPSEGMWLSQESGPMITRIRPSETFRNARTTCGSNCVPAHFAISWRPSALFPASLYDRAEVITSKTSATATMRPGSGMSSPRSLRG